MQNNYNEYNLMSHFHRYLQILFIKSNVTRRLKFKKSLSWHWLEFCFEIYWLKIAREGVTINCRQEPRKAYFVIKMTNRLIKDIIKSSIFTILVILDNLVNFIDFMLQIKSSLLGQMTKEAI